MSEILRLLKEKLLLDLQVTQQLVAITKKQAIESLQQKERYRRDGCLVPFGYKMYSKNEEDGLIREIFNRIGATSKTFVEIGVEAGLENNTLALLFEGWRGLWIEGSPEHVRTMQAGFQKTIAEGRLSVAQAFITRGNINQMIGAHFSGEIDLLSIDIDGNDYHVFDAITVVSPRVLVIEYNGKFRPPVMYCMAYDEKYQWDGTDNFGASLKFLEVNLKEKGYVLVGCNLTGGNAFFVKEALAADRFLPPYTAENHYEPARYELSAHAVGHRPSYKTLENRLADVKRQR